MERVLESGNVKGFLIDNVLHLCRPGPAKSCIHVNGDIYKYYCRCWNCSKDDRDVHPDIAAVVRIAKEYGAKQLAYRHVELSTWWSWEHVMIEGLPCVEACFYNGYLREDVWVDASGRRNDAIGDGPYARSPCDYYARVTFWKLIEFWTERLGREFKVTLERSIKSQTIVWNGLEAISADVRFIHASPEDPAVRSRIEEVTGLTSQVTFPPLILERQVNVPCIPFPIHVRGVLTIP